MARYAAALLVFMALLGLSGCLIIDGGGYYSSQYVCYDVVVDYYWTGWAWAPIYQTVCGWEELTDGVAVAGYREIAKKATKEGKTLVTLEKDWGAALDTNQVIAITHSDGTTPVIQIGAVSKPEVREGAEANNPPSPTK